jgi:hypothetical protein
MVWRENWPVSLEVVFEKIELGDDKKDRNRARKEVSGGIEEKEGARHASHYYHDPASDANDEKTNDVKGT